MGYYFPGVMWEDISGTVAAMLQCHPHHSTCLQCGAVRSAALDCGGVYSRYTGLVTHIQDTAPSPTLFRAYKHRGTTHLGGTKSPILFLAEA
ncbi:hypothetical protein C0J52_14803 [Blattella germanica]|nr:hypothetical protein C0J52_14803 [Blattella germanica]